MKKLIVAIDGPAGAGKSTVARIVAKRLCYTYIDTGAMYRAVTWDVMRRQIAVNDSDLVAKVAGNIKLRLEYSGNGTLVYVDDTDVTEVIRTPDISRMVSAVSQIGGVRQAMVELQRKMAAGGGVVMDGRDIGTHVLPNADVKIFLTASIEERARRRWLELTSKGFKIDIEDLKNEISCRDQADCERVIAPLIQAEDAVVIDTTALTIEQAVDNILLLCEAIAGGL
ncbi:MAG: Cytidylate kinase [Firmicutes bacterium]|nr:Cytidylate kinase [Bacillota bacterium]